MIAKSWAEEDREFEESVCQIAEIQSSSSSAKKSLCLVLRQVSYSGSLSAEEESKSTCKSQSNYRHAGTKDRERNPGLGRLQYISRFIAQLTPICEPIFKLLRNQTPTVWNEDCQKAFDKVQKSLLNPPILVPPTPGRPLLMYLSVMEASRGCVLGQHDETGRKERAIYYLSKKFTDDETRYTVLEKTCCALTWASQRLRHYMLNYIPC